MPQIDVTQALLSPIIAGTSFDVIRREERVGDDGVAVLHTSTIPNQIGSVFPAGDNSLVRAEAYTQQADTIEVITSFRLRGVAKDDGDKTYQPDIVGWKGSFYLVRDLQDYSQFGAGMMVAQCIEYPYVGPPALVEGPVTGRLDFSNLSNSGLVGLC